MTTADARVDASVVTLVRDRTAHLRRLVAGLDRDGARPAELVVVVMGGEDPSPAWEGAGLVVRVVRCDLGPALPLAAARNRGAAVARRDHLVFLDVDCIPEVGLVGAYARALLAHDAVLMGGVTYLPPGVPRGAPPDDATLRARGRPHPARPLPGPGVHTCTEPELFWSLSFAVRRSTFAALGGFDERYVGYGGEDTDFARRVVRAGVELAWLGGAVAHHQHHASWDPPLPHLDAIVANARTFRETWGTWPMTGWLEAFAAAGIVDWAPGGRHLSVRRRPTDRELADARRDHPPGGPRPR